MSHMRHIFLLWIALWALPAYGREDEYVVIVHQENDQVLTRPDVKNIYLGRVTHWANGDPIRAYDLPLNDPTRKRFSTEILGMPTTDVATYWADKIITNTAIHTPRTKRPRLTLATVRRNRNAIGYVPRRLAESATGIRIVPLSRE